VALVVEGVDQVYLAVLHRAVVFLVKVMRAGVTLVLMDLPLAAVEVLELLALTQ
jgi:hypothetical protein